MKASLILLVVATVAHGVPVFVVGGAGGAVGGGAGGAAQRTAPRGQTQRGFAPLRPTNPKANFGPKFYGQGLENPYAFPVNQFAAQHARSLIAQVPGALARVDIDGDITFTNQFGQEVDIVDRFGRDQSELYEF